jgi:hypothetical protein
MAADTSFDSLIVLLLPDGSDIDATSDRRYFFPESETARTPDSYVYIGSLADLVTGGCDCRESVLR